MFRAIKHGNGVTSYVKDFYGWRYAIVVSTFDSELQIVGYRSKQTDEGYGIRQIENKFLSAYLLNDNHVPHKFYFKKLRGDESYNEWRDINWLQRSTSIRVAKNEILRYIWDQVKLMYTPLLPAVDGHSVP